jgi:uncharacterized tellurite resistance protein B-like protein
VIRRLTQFFEAHFVEQVQQDDQRGIEFATAALLIEVSRSDNDKGDQEQASIIGILTSLFHFNSEELATLMAAAEDAVDDAHDLHQFTRLVNETYDYDGRKRLVVALWQVAFADGRVDKFEEHIIRRIAGLLHIDNSDFTEAKHIARQPMQVGR